MARMHSRKKGKSGSTRPSEIKKPVWLRYNQKEIEQLVVKLAKSKKTPSQIGMHLRDVYGIPDVKSVTEKSVGAILDEKKLSTKVPEDLTALIKKTIAIRKHLEENKQDKPAQRGLVLTESKIMRLTKYYKKAGKLSADWKYDPKQASLTIE